MQIIVPFECEVRDNRMYVHQPRALRLNCLQRACDTLKVGTQGHYKAQVATLQTFPKIKCKCWQFHSFRIPRGQVKMKITRFITLYHQQLQIELHPWEAKYDFKSVCIFLNSTACVVLLLDRGMSRCFSNAVERYWILARRYIVRQSLSQQGVWTFLMEWECICIKNIMVVGNGAQIWFQICYAFAWVKEL